MSAGRRLHEGQSRVGGGSAWTRAVPARPVPRPGARGGGSSRHVCNDPRSKHVPPRLRGGRCSGGRRRHGHRARQRGSCRRLWSGGLRRPRRVLCDADPNSVLLTSRDERRQHRLHIMLRPRRRRRMSPGEDTRSVPAPGFSTRTIVFVGVRDGRSVSNSVLFLFLGNFATIALRHAVAKGGTTRTTGVIPVPRGTSAARRWSSAIANSRWGQGPISGRGSPARAAPIPRGRSVFPASLFHPGHEGRERSRSNPGSPGFGQL